MARHYIAERAKHSSGKPILRYWRHEWWLWDNGSYRRVAERELAAQVTHSIKRYISKNAVGGKFLSSVTRNLVGNVLQALASELRIPETVDQPAWIGREPGYTNYLSLKNGLLDLERASTGGQASIRTHTPDWFTPVQLPIEFDGKADCPQWEAFLDEVLERDQERIALLQEFFGYLLTPDTSFHKFMVLEGEGANGKSVVLEVIGAMLGEANVSHVPIDSLGDRFQNTMTLNRLANIAPEVNETADLNEGMLKQFISGDRMYCDRKGIPGVEAKPTARLIVATNSRPAISDRSQGMWRRMLYLPFRISIPTAQQDRELAKKLRLELPGIFNWALAGRKRLLENGLFTEPTVSKEALADYRAESNPAATFLRERCALDASAQVLTDVLYRNYWEWAKGNGFTPLSSAQFGKELRKIYPTVRKLPATATGARPWVYQGLTIESGDSAAPGADIGTDPAALALEEAA